MRAQIKSQSFSSLTSVITLLSVPLCVLASALVFLLASPAANAGVKESIEGTTQKEREIRWLWKYLGVIVRSCASTGAECDQLSLKRMVSELSSYLPLQEESTSSPWGRRLEFVSERARPGLFQTGLSETHRLAVTQLSRDATIYINTDRMDRPLGEWAGILAHEATHHLGYDDDSQRLPDQIGAAVRSHFERLAIESNLAEFGHPELSLIFFNALSTTRAQLALISLQNQAMDQELGPSALVGICEGDEEFRGQLIQSPLWRMIRMQAERGVVTVRAASKMISDCVSRSSGHTQKRQTSFVFQLDLHFGGPIDPESSWWRRPSTIDFATSLAGPTDSSADLVDLNRTFVIQSVAHESTIVTAGNAWRVKVVVESLDGYRPTVCSIHLAGLKWSFMTGIALPANDTFDSCRLTSLGGDRWQIDAEKLVPLNAQPDFFYVPIIQFPFQARASEQGFDRFAMPAKPQFIRVQNTSALSPLRVSAWRVLGLSPAGVIGRTRLVNSFRARQGQSFTVEVDLQGTQLIGIEALDLDLFAVQKDSIFLLPWQQSVDAMPDVIVSKAKIPIPGGTRLRYEVVVPTSKWNVEIRGFKFRRFYYQTDDYSWAELELSKVVEGMILGPNFTDF